MQIGHLSNTVSPIHRARVLTFLLKSQDKTIIQKDIEEYLELRHPTIIGILQRMEAKGLIVSTVDQQDKRQKIIALTDSAFELEKKITDHVEDARTAYGGGPDARRARYH